MSFWTDIRDVVTSVPTTIGNILATPFVALSDIIEGKNVGEVIGTSVKRGIGGALDLQGGLLFAGARSEAGQGILRNKITDKLTFGLSTDTAGISQSAKKLETGQDVSRGEVLEMGRFGLKSAVVVASAGVAAGASSAGAAAQTALPVYGAAQSVQAKNYFGAASGLAGGLGIGTDLGGTGFDLSDVIGGLAPKPAKPSAPKRSGYPLSTQSGYDDGFSDAGPPIVLIAGVGVLGFLVLKKLRKI